MRVEKQGRIILLIVVLLIAMSQGVGAIGIKPFDQSHPMADQDGDKIFDDLMLEMETGNGLYPVIVQLTEEANSNNLDYIQSGIGPFTPTYIYRILNGFAAELTRDQILQLAAYPVVEQIQWDAPVAIYMSTATEGFGINQARRQFQVDGDRDGDSQVFTSQDVVIALVDTGIDVGHMDLPQSKVLGWYDLIEQSETPYDDHGHGTHVAGIAAGLGIANADYTGVAPGAGLVAVKAVDGTGKSRMSIVDAGIEWVIQQQAQLGIDILSISFGTQGTSDGTDSTSQLVNQAVEAGITVVAAVGNQGANLQTIGSPAVAAESIAIGGMADQGEGGEFLAYFTSRGPTLDGRAKPDLVAPGWRIMAPQANTQDQYIVFSGTSMAAPFTAGAIALLLDQNPALTPQEIKQILFQSAEDWGPTGWDVDYGMGRLQIANGLQLITSPETPLNPDYYHYRGEEDLPADGFYDQWSINLTDLRHNLAITMVTELETKEDDFNLYLYDPNGNLVAKGERGGRQEWISHRPQMTGTYTLEVVSYRGSGDYYLDLHGEIDYLYLSVDNRL